MHVFDSATIAQLLDWCSNHGVYIDSRLEIKESEDSEAGITVFSREPITNRTARKKATGCITQNLRMILTF